MPINRPGPSFQQRMQGQQQQPPTTADPIGNVDVPMGDPVDMIAQMLGLDLTAEVGPDQQGQKVVNAVEALVKKLHELTGTPETEQPGEVGQEEFVDEQDPNADPNIDPNTDPDQEQEGEEDPDVEEQDEPEDEEMPVQQKPKKKGFAASYGGLHQIPDQILQLSRDNRQLRIKQLVQGGFATPATGQLLLSKFCSDESLALSMTDELVPDNTSFDLACSLLESQGPVIHFGEVTGDQSKLSRMSAKDGALLSLSDDELRDDEANPLLADAVKRTKQQPSQMLRNR